MDGNRLILIIGALWDWINIDCRLQTSFGSFGWMPPEINPLIDKQIFKGKGNYFTYDIWSLGLIILYIVSGTQPYDVEGWIMTERHWYKK